MLTTKNADRPLNQQKSNIKVPASASSSQPLPSCEPTTHPRLPSAATNQDATSSHDGPNPTRIHVLLRGDPFFEGHLGTLLQIH